MKRPRTPAWKVNTAAFLFSQIFSIFGSSIVQYTIIWHITLDTQSGLYAAVSILCNLLPMFVLMPFVGVWADRYNRKWIINLADGFTALVALAVALLYSIGAGGNYILLGALILRSFGSAVQSPCVNAMFPDFVPADQLTRVNGVYSTLYSITQIAAPILAAALLTLLPLEGLFYIDVMTAGVAILILGLGLRLPKRERAAPEAGGGFAREIKEGFGYIGKTPFLRSMFTCMAVQFFLSTPVFYLMPLHVTRTYGETVWYLSGVEIALTAGMLAGGLLMATWGGFKSKRVTMSWGGFIMAAVTLFTGVKSSIWLLLAAIAAFGIGNAMESTPMTVMIQEHSDERYMGRVFSVLSMLNTCMLQLGMIVFGPLADLVDIRWLLIACGAPQLLVAAALWRSRPLKELERKPKEELPGHE